MQYIFLFLLVHNSEFLEILIKSYCTRPHTLMWSSTQWVKNQKGAIATDFVSLYNTLLKSDVTTRDHVVRCRGSQECGSRSVNFACKFHRRSHRVRITLKSTNIVVHAQKECVNHETVTTELVTFGL